MMKPAVGASETMLIDPMRVYVLWASSFAKVGDPGHRLAHALRDQLDVLGMVRDGVGFRVPVRQRSSLWRPTPYPRRIDLSAARSNVVIVVEDDVMLGRRNVWTEYVAELAAQIDARGGADLLLSVTVSQQSGLPALADRQLQGIRRLEPDGDEAAWSAWLRHVMMYAMGSIWVHQRTLRLKRNETALASSRDEIRKLKVFLSHAKKDGDDAARLIKRFKNSAPPKKDQGGVNSIDMYFDAYDTIAGKPYPEQFERAIKDGALLSIVTDAYHGRPWCLWELLAAKRHRSPIVIWDLSHQGTLRSFPYLGNVPVVRTPDAKFATSPTAGVDELDVESLDDMQVERVLLALLSEALRMEVWVAHAEALVETSTMTAKTTLVCARPPELADLVHHGAAGTRTIVYPDPPMGQHERELLAAGFPQLTLVPLSEVS